MFGSHFPLLPHCEKTRLQRCKMQFYKSFSCGFQTNGCEVSDFSTPPNALCVPPTLSKHGSQNEGTMRNKWKEKTKVEENKYSEKNRERIQFGEKNSIIGP